MSMQNGMPLNKIILWAGIAVFFVIGLVWVIRSFQDESSNPQKASGGITRGNPPKLPITKHWSGTLTIAPPYSIYADVEEEDVAVIHRYNGGPANGGWDDPVPARKNRGANWVPKFFDKMVTSVCYAVDQNEKRGEATIVYSIVR